MKWQAIQIESQNKTWLNAYIFENKGIKIVGENMETKIVDLVK